MPKIKDLSQAVFGQFCRSVRGIERTAVTLNTVQATISENYCTSRQNRNWNRVTAEDPVQARLRQATVPLERQLRGMRWL